MRPALIALPSLLRRCWSYLREWSGDDAYERYVAEHRDHGHGHDLLDRREFYRQYFDRRGNRPEDDRESEKTARDANHVGLLNVGDSLARAQLNPPARVS